MPGLAPCEVTPEGLRLAGVQTVPAVRERLARTIRTVGTVVADETRIRHVHTKIPGWVEKLFVNFTGQAVRKGEPILSIYSPELLATQEEYLRARETAARFAASELPEVRKGGEDLRRGGAPAARAVRRAGRLHRRARAHRQAAARRSPSIAPVSGFVTAKDVFEGQQVEPAMELFTITDLSRVWVEAEFYEYEARAVRLGEEAAVDAPLRPGTQPRRPRQRSSTRRSTPRPARSGALRVRQPRPGAQARDVRQRRALGRAPPRAS